MDDDLCHLCFEKCAQMKYNFQHSIENTNIQEFIEAFTQIIFEENTYTFDTICMKCLQTLQQFSQYCERIRSLHRDLVDESYLVQSQKLEDDQMEILLENIEEYGTEQELEHTVEVLDIDTDAGDDGCDNRRNIMELTPRIVAKLEEQLKFEAKSVDLSDTNFTRFAQFIPMECGECEELQFVSFEDYHDHFLFIHNRSAMWNCCNLVLETPYDALDHLKYHESVDHFKCAACYKCFLSSNKLKYHIRRTHLPIDGLYSCTICAKDFKNLRLLLNHQKSHIRITCPHCKKAVTASNYEQHVRTIHACLPSTKRKSTAKTDASAKKRKSNEKLAAPINPKPQKTVQSFAVNTEPNENGMFECDICRMEFKQVSLVYSHRNKVHV